MRSIKKRKKNLVRQTTTKEKTRNFGRFEATSDKIFKYENLKLENIDVTQLD